MGVKQETEPPLRGGPEWWRRSFSSMTGLGTTNEQRLQHETAGKNQRTEKESQRCKTFLDFLKNNSPMVIFMLDEIRKAGGSLNENNIQCLPCDSMQSGGFSPRYGVLLCQNHLRDRGHTEDTLAHELVHVYDHLKFDIDWQDLKHHACSEIRASSLSGECRWTRELFTRGVWDFTRQHQACVRRRAALSVRNHPKCKDDAHAARVVNSVFKSCFADTQPFDEIYR
ncbi:peptidase M76 family-domain-containing protein [Geopyxis carbonaria]|nr:peptidase M76 family-domain-containing protein [Geopyxis carbonaria]